MLTSDNFKTITQLRLKTLDVINAVVIEKKLVYIISRSKPQAIIISIEEYGKLLEIKRENKKLKEQLEGERKLK